MTEPQGTEGLLAFADDLREVAPHVPQAYDLRKAEKMMLKAADIITRLAPFEPEIEAVVGEN